MATPKQAARRDFGFGYVNERRKTTLDGEPGPEGPDGPTVAQQEIVRLFAEHNGTLVRFLRARLGSDHEARDVAQEAYVRLLQIDKPGTVSFLRAYLFKTAANIATDRRRREAVRGIAHRDPVFDMRNDDLDPERSALAKERLRIVQAGIAELPERSRLAFLLHRVSDMSIADVAVRLGLSERMVRNHVVKALVHIRLKLDAADERDIRKGRPL
jgi:RNA polymerase sigma factor (sigma-70 family)